MRYVSLFAGIGGFDLALNRLGHVCVWANEWDKYAAQIYNKNFERTYIGEESEQKDSKQRGIGITDERNLQLCDRSEPATLCDTRDIRTVPTGEIPDHDLLVGGVPCQSWSIAGKRGGFEDERGNMWFECFRILRDKQPKYFIFENVKGLLSHDGGKSMERICEELCECGYAIDFEVLNSKNFGVPQNRERVFIVGFRLDLLDGCQVFTQNENDRKTENKITTKSKDKNGGIQLSSGYLQYTYAKRHFRGEPRPEVFPIGTGGQENDDARVLSHTLNSSDWRGANRNQRQTTIQTGCGKAGQLHQMHGGSRGTRVYDTEGVSATITSQGGGQGAKTGLYAVLTPNRAKKRQNGRRFKRAGEPSFTLTGQDIHGVSDGLRIRRLTPTECELLQGFPQGWTARGVDMNGNEVDISDSQRYKVLGNAVSVPVVEALVRRLCPETI